MQTNKTSRLAVLALVGLGAVLGFVASQFSTDPLPRTVAADRDNPNSQAQEFSPEPSLTLPINETPLGWSG